MTTTMTPAAYRKAAIALCRQFDPVSEKQWDAGWHEFQFQGFHVGLHLRNSLPFTRKVASDWISIGIANPHELPPFCDHWKWNIHYSGSPGPVRVELLRELGARLARLREFYANPVGMNEGITTAIRSSPPIVSNGAAVADFAAQ